MPEPREATTEQLSYVIHTMQLEQQTGMLRVERSYWNTSERGTVVFANGKIVQASVGPIRGVEALNSLSEWGFCRFIFIPGPLGELAQMDHPLPASTSSSSSASSPSPSPITPSTRNTPPSNLHSAHNGYGAETGPLPAITRPFPAAAATRKLPVVTRQSDAINTPARTPTAIFHRLQEGSMALHYIEQLKLTRAHRRLFLLIDGRRCAPDLAHLIGKTLEEIYPLLHDLEQARLIQHLPS